MNICLIGAAGNGKTTLAEALVEQRGYTRLSFATPVKELSVDVYNLIAEYIGEPTITKEHFHANKGDYRTLMQVVGTELGRDMFRESVWVDEAVKRIGEIQTPVVIDDCRFINELDSLLRLGFVPFYIYRFPHNMEHSSESLDYSRLAQYMFSTGRRDFQFWGNTKSLDVSITEFIDLVDRLTNVRNGAIV